MTRSTNSDEDLFHTLAARARSTSDGGFGAWGIADRELAEHTATRRLSGGMLRIVRVVSLVVGACAAIVAAFALLGVALGTWIS